MMSQVLFVIAASCCMLAAARVSPKTVDLFAFGIGVGFVGLAV